MPPVDDDPALSDRCRPACGPLIATFRIRTVPMSPASPVCVSHPKRPPQGRSGAPGGPALRAAGGAGRRRLSELSRTPALRAQPEAARDRDQRRAPEAPRPPSRPVGARHRSRRRLAHASAAASAAMPTPPPRHTHEFRPAALWTPSWRTSAGPTP